MVWRTNERLTHGNEIPKKSCRPLQGSAGAAGERDAFFYWRRSVSERGRCFSEGKGELFVWVFFGARGEISIARQERGTFLLRGSRPTAGEVVWAVVRDF